MAASVLLSATRSFSDEDPVIKTPLAEDIVYVAPVGLPPEARICSESSDPVQCRLFRNRMVEVNSIVTVGGASNAQKMREKELLASRRSALKDVVSLLKRDSTKEDAVESLSGEVAEIADKMAELDDELRKSFADMNAFFAYGATINAMAYEQNYAGAAEEIQKVLEVLEQNGGQVYDPSGVSVSGSAKAQP